MKINHGPHCLGDGMCFMEGIVRNHTFDQVRKLMEFYDRNGYVHCDVVEPLLKAVDAEDEG